MVEPADGNQREFPVLVAGLATCLLTAIVIYVVAVVFNTNISSWTLWFVIPVGAAACGMAAASGSYGAAVLLNQPPSKRMAWNMAMLGFATYWLSQYLAYVGLSYEGKPISDYVGFWDYYRLAVTNAELVMLRGGHSAGEVGSWGYALAGLQIAGFSLGGLALWAFLSDKQYCDNCRRYFRSKVILAGATPEQVDAYLARLPFSFPGLADHIVKTIGGRKYSGLRIVLHSCPKCTQKRIAFEVERRNDTDVAKVYNYEGDLELPGPGCPHCGKPFAKGSHFIRCPHCDADLR